MKHWLALIGFILLNLPQGVVAQNVVNLAATEFPPYLGEHLEHGGVMTQIAQEAYERVGYQVNVHYHPWARALALVRIGELDGLVQVWMREERKEWLLFSAPIPSANSEVVFYKRKDLNIEFDGKDYLALKPYTIGAGRGYADPEGFEKIRDQLRVEIVTTDIQNLKKLELGRIDLMIVDKFVAQYLLETQMPESVASFDWLGSALSLESNHMGVSRKAPEARKKLEDFNRGLVLLKQEGRIQGILAEHGLRD